MAPPLYYFVLFSVAHAAGSTGRGATRSIVLGVLAVQVVCGRRGGDGAMATAMLRMAPAARSSAWSGSARVEGVSNVKGSATAASGLMRDDINENTLIDRAAIFPCGPIRDKGTTAPLERWLPAAGISICFIPVGTAHRFSTKTRRLQVVPRMAVLMAATGRIHRRVRLGLCAVPSAESSLSVAA